MDTLVVYLFICVDSLLINPKNVDNNRFKNLFKQADSCFNKEYKIDIEKNEKSFRRSCKISIFKNL